MIKWLIAIMICLMVIAIIILSMIMDCAVEIITYVKSINLSVVEKHPKVDVAPPRFSIDTRGIKDYRASLEVPMNRPSAIGKDFTEELEWIKYELARDMLNEIAQNIDVINEPDFLRQKDRFYGRLRVVEGGKSND